jgi:hypothetical protein
MPSSSSILRIETFVQGATQQDNPEYQNPVHCHDDQQQAPHRTYSYNPRYVD